MLKGDIGAASESSSGSFAYYVGLTVPRRHLAVYAELFHADDDVTTGSLVRCEDPGFARQRWASHLVRACWFIGDGLHNDIKYFCEVPRHNPLPL